MYIIHTLEFLPLYELDEVIYINYILKQTLLITNNTLISYGNINEPGGVCMALAQCVHMVIHQTAWTGDFVLAWTTFTRFSQFPCLLGLAWVELAHLCIASRACRLATAAQHMPPDVAAENRGSTIDILYLLLAEATLGRQQSCNKYKFYL